MIITIDLELLLMVMFSPIIIGFEWALKIVNRQLKRWRETSVQRTFTLESGEQGSQRFHEKGVSFYIKHAGGLPFLLAVWCIVAIEMTLHWNSFSQVYEVRTTGQIIPLVTGVSWLLDTILKTELFEEKPTLKWRRPATTVGQSDDDDETSSPPTAIALQSSDEKAEDITQGKIKQRPRSAITI